MFGRCVFALAILGFLAGCGGGTGDPVTSPTPLPVPEGAEIVTPGIESYTTDHNGYARARISRAENSDAPILAQFDDSNPDSPAGYRNLITLAEERYVNTMFIEVIAEVQSDSGDGETVSRILRLTADQASFNNVDANGRLIAAGQFFFRGEALVFATVDDQPLAVGKGRLENLMVDFDTGTAIIDIQTGFHPDTGSAIETSLVADDLDFNVVTGAFGGPVTLSSRSALNGETTSSEGVLRGNLSGDEASLTRLQDDLTASGLFTVGETGDRLVADGVFWGGQLPRAN